MDFLERKRLIQNTFNTVAESYDNPVLRFFNSSALCLADLLELEGDEDLLDVACGTGAVSLVAASRLPRGHVTGMDFSEGMLKRAREKAKSKGLGNVEFISMDIEKMDFPAGRFDAACCSFGIFFLEDMARAMTLIADKVKAGGRVVISSFGNTSFSPLSALFLDRIKSYGIEVPPLSWERLASNEAVSEFFSAAGLNEIEVHSKDLSYYLEDANEWWQFLRSAGFRGVIDQIPDEDLDRFCAQHFEEVSRHLTEQGLFIKVDCLYGVGIK